MNTLTNNQKVLIAALVGFIIGAGAIWVWTVSNSATREMPQQEEDQEAAAANANDSKTSTATAAPTGATPAPAVISMDDSELVDVSDQKAGSQVAVTATFDTPGWVAIHEDRDGSLGNVLGARWLPGGEHETTVTLLRATVAGKTYHAVLYNDDGDHQFEYKAGDAALLDSSKQPIQSSFTTN